MIEKIAREVTATGSFTVIYLSMPDGIRVQRIPTSNYEHARIKQIFLQDGPYAGVHNDFSAFKMTGRS